MNETQKRILNIAELVADFKQSIASGTLRGIVDHLEYYTYSANFFTYADATGFTNGLAAGATSQVTIDIASDTDFLMLYINSNGGPNFNNPNIYGLNQGPNAIIQITNNTQNRAFFSNPMYLPIATGTGCEPYIMQQGELLEASTQLITTVTNNSSLVLFGQVSFCGLKIYYKSGPGN